MSCALSSPTDPFETDKNWINSLFPSRSKPSAKLESTEMEARCICAAKMRSELNLGLRRVSPIALTNARHALKDSKSRKFLISAIAETSQLLEPGKRKSSGYGLHASVRGPWSTNHQPLTTNHQPLTANSQRLTANRSRYH